MVRLTTLNSVYELDAEGARARRVEGKRPPTANTGTDGEWKGLDVWTMLPNGAALIQWADGTATMTSRVTGREDV